MSNITQARRAVVARILEGDGSASHAQRRAAFDSAELPISGSNSQRAYGLRLSAEHPAHLIPERNGVPASRPRVVAGAPRRTAAGQPTFRKY
jgi:hypothetical protein